MKHVHLVHHAYETDDGHDEIKLIGVYSSFELAQAAVERLKGQPGFRDRPDAFRIDEYEVDKDHWTDGYISVQEALDALPDDPNAG